MNTSVALSTDAAVRWNGAPLNADVDGETVLMSVERGRYYGLDAIGADIWRRLETPTRVAALCAALSEAYDGDPAVIERDVLALLQRLLEEGLIEVAE